MIITLSKNKNSLKTQMVSTHKVFFGEMKKIVENTLPVYKWVHSASNEDTVPISGGC
jgi:hypothetical protein